MMMVTLTRLSGSAVREATYVRGGLALVQEWEGRAAGNWMIIHARSGTALFQVATEAEGHRAAALLLEIADWTRRGSDLASDDNVRRRVREIERLLWLEGTRTGGGAYVKDQLLDEALSR